MNAGSRSPKTEAPHLGNWRLSLPTELQNAGGDARGEDPGGDRSCHLQGTLTLSRTWDIQVDIYDQRQLGKDSEEDQRWKIDLNTIITRTLIKDPAVVLTHPLEEGQCKKPQARCEPGLESVLLLLSFLWSPNPSYHLSLPGEMFACP